MNRLNNLIFGITILIWSSQTFFLSPQYPSTAFYKQFYEVRFRVRGMDFPSFTFEGLPEFLTGSEDGVISGKPTRTGTFRVKIFFKSVDQQGSHMVIIKVAAGNVNQQSQRISRQLTLKIIVNAYDTWIYAVGSEISIHLSSQGGSGIMVWNFNNLPPGLVGNGNGEITGKVTKPGEYTFSAQLGDKEGNSDVSYFTINVIHNENKQKEKLTQPPIASELGIFSSQISNIEKYSTEEKAMAYQLLRLHTQIYDSAKEKSKATNLTFHKAEKEFNKTDDQYQIVLKPKQISKNNYQNKKNQMETKKNQLFLAKINIDNNNNAVSNAEIALSQAQTNFKKTINLFNQANVIFNNDKSNLQESLSQLNSRNISLTMARIELQNAWVNLQTKKQFLVDLENKLEEISMNLENQKNTKDLAKEVNNQAQTNFQKADRKSKQANKQLKKAENTLFELRQRQRQVKLELGAAKFNLQQAENNLYIAQAIKQAADRVIALSQVNSTQFLKRQSTYIFEGCVNEFYPFTQGSDQVTKLIQHGCLLASGAVVLWGECSTIVGLVKVGSMIRYEGRFIGGIINAKIIKSL